MGLAFDYVAKTALETESTYPYRANDGTCSYKTANGVVKIAKHVDVEQNDPNAL